MNAEIRRAKARMMEEVPKLQKLALKKVKGLSKEDLTTRNDLVLALPERIQSIPDGTTSGVKQTGGWAASSSHKNIRFDSGIDRQVPLIDEIDTKVDKATIDLKNNNVRLKETLTKVRSSRNFCVDIILLCIILGIASYLYK
ncbi:syntaxin of plants 73 [Actinidia rufa]|uniref:Syntaxin of plants 73 n=1 Tax=Actinidia rufa TaxID=165716 RepID=A0A7J0HBK3_9ERIC|nr:syntaxin of plants 73 [Actinidia rufa]